MLKGALTVSIAILALALLAQALVSGLTTSPDQPAHVAALAEAPVPERAADREATGYREASLAADARGQYAADALVDGVPVRMLVDTGASVVTISAATAARIGLTPSPGPKWRLRTANGESLASPATLELGELRRPLPARRPGAYPGPRGGRRESARREFSQAARQRRAAGRDPRPQAVGPRHPAKGASDAAVRAAGLSPGPLGETTGLRFNDP